MDENPPANLSSALKSASKHTSDLVIRHKKNRKKVSHCHSSAVVMGTETWIQRLTGVVGNSHTCGESGDETVGQEDERASRKEDGMFLRGAV